MPNDLRSEDIDKVCMHCGEVIEGPHKGDTVPLDRPADPGSRLEMHKGAYVSRCGGHGCPAEVKHNKAFWGEYFAGSKRAKSHQRKKSDGDIKDIPDI